MRAWCEWLAVNLTELATARKAEGNRVTDNRQPTPRGDALSVVERPLSVADILTAGPVATFSG